MPVASVAVAPPWWVVVAVVLVVLLVVSAPASLCLAAEQRTAELPRIPTSPSKHEHTRHGIKSTDKHTNQPHHTTITKQIRDRSETTPSAPTNPKLKTLDRDGATWEVHDLLTQAHDPKGQTMTSQVVKDRSRMCGGLNRNEQRETASRIGKLRERNQALTISTDHRKQIVLSEIGIP